MTKPFPIYYFIKELVPTSIEFEKAAQLMGKGPRVEFISLETFDLNQPLHEVSGVAGEVPEPYKDVNRIDVPLVPQKTNKKTAE